MSGVPTDIPCPALCDWAWRPEPWRQDIADLPEGPLASGRVLSDGVRIFHDGGGHGGDGSEAKADIAIRQEDGGVDGAAKALALQVGAFDGQFLSFTFNLPRDGIAGLSPRVILAARLALAPRPTLPIFLRLNIRKGPNTEAVPGLPVPGGEDGSVLAAEFDLGFRNIQAGRVANAWLDVIFDHPAGLSVILSDLTLSRRPRAGF